MSDHIRIRSISLRSIRGIYFRRGDLIWKIDRVGYVWTSVEGRRRIAVKIDGGSLHVLKTGGKAQKVSRHNRNLTLADLNPSPLARYAWTIISTIATYFEPYVRPFLRSSFIACLRVGIKWLPKITQALSFDLHSVVLTFAEVPGARIVIEETNLHSTLDLMYMEHVPEAPDNTKPLIRPDTRTGQGMAVWKRRLAESFQRSLDNALGDSRGTATLSLKISNIMGTMPRQLSDDSINVPFLLSPGIIDLNVSVKFNPKEGAIDPRGLDVSLKLGDCSAKVDMLNILLEQTLRKRSSPPNNTQRQPLSPLSPYTGNFLPSAPIFQAPPSALLSPAQSLKSSIFSASSLLSPSKIMSSNTSSFSPTSTNIMSPMTPKSPSSPFLQAISASMRPKRRHVVVPSVKLKEYKDHSSTLIINSAKMFIASVTLSVLTETQTGPYRAQIKDVSLALVVSDPSTNQLHREHLGFRTAVERFDSDALALTIALGQLTLERDSNHHIMRLARLGLITLDCLAFQWPTPLLIPKPFMSNDPNDSFFAIHLKIASIHLTDRLQDLYMLVNFFKFSKNTENLQQTTEPVFQSASKPPSFPVPRFSIAAECGTIVARVIYDADSGQKHRAIELRNNGFSMLLDSRYGHPSTAIRRHFPAASSVQALHWTLALAIGVEPFLVRVRSKHNFIGHGEPNLQTSDKDFLDDPPVLSIGSISISGLTNAVAQIDGSPDSFAVMDISTLMTDLSLTLETICIELWHPVSVDATLRLISLISHPMQLKTSEKKPTNPRFLHLPTGLTAKVAVARFIVFITAPDINPHDTMELSRGFALRTSASLEYSSLQANQTQWLNNVQRSQKRAVLLLPTEAFTDAATAAKLVGPHGDKSAFIKGQLNNLVFETAVATQYEPDEPVIVGREDILDDSKDIIRIDTVQIDVCLSYKKAEYDLQYTDTCDITIHIPLIRAFFQLAHAYSILLGLQTVNMLNPPQKPTPSSVASEYPKPDIVILFRGNITAVQALLTLPTQKLVLNLDGFSSHLISGDSPRVKWSKATVFVALPSQVSRWEVADEDRWDEFITLQAWEISFTTVAGSLCVSVDGDSGRLRIPHGFILADLVQDVSVSVKAIKHIACMASAGCYSDMPDPDPEGPKSIPHLTIRLGYLCLEAQDDPFESRLGLIWTSAPEAIKQRIDREAAFEAKVAAILSEEPGLASTSMPKVDTEYEYQFNAQHSVSIQEARKRLDDVHSLDWALRLEQAKEQRSKDEHSILHKLYGTSTPTASKTLLKIMTQPKFTSDPPLLRAMLENLCLTVSPPSFSAEQLPDVIHNLGSGLPRDTKFSLLVPLHIHFTLSSMKFTLRNYPIPLVNIPRRPDAGLISWTFDTDLIIGEEMGTKMSVDWIRCPIIEAHQSLHGEAPFSILVPKTIMPVKTYATPIIKIATPEPTAFSWGVSYGPAIQDLMRIIDTLSSSPRDHSPTLGFWDKMRLVFHWTIKITFTGDVQLFMKGTRDPCNVLDTGAGFVLCWQGNPEIRIGYENLQKELVQVTSDGMVIAVPNLDPFIPKARSFPGKIAPLPSRPFQKVFAQLSSGVRYGIGFVLERSCGCECLFCTGTAFERKCRYFSFRPHYEVMLEKKESPPALKGPDDSYNGFRSDFIHLSLSLACSTKAKERITTIEPSSLYLTPKLFAHFWSWCYLFDGALTLPIRQGNYYPSRPISPKLGRHLATLKYRISLPNLYFTHGYIDDSRETWVDGVTPWVGLKGKVDELQVDMHQREEESIVPGPVPNTTRILRRKPFYAAEVIMKGLELRALLAIFQEPMKQNIDMTAPSQKSNYRKHTDLPITPPSSIWYDLGDFQELDWSPPDHCTLHLLPLAACPHFTYFKRNETLSGSHQASKFGSEHSHMCLLGKEPSIPKTQMNLALARVAELKDDLAKENISQPAKTSSEKRALTKMISLLDDYISVLREVEIRPENASQRDAAGNYYIPSDIVSSDEWAEFDNVYQIHCPSIFMDSATRDIMMQYYYCSRDRRGSEYHLAARAVKFIRDQANAALSLDQDEASIKDRGTPNAAQMAASALRKVLKGDNSTKVPLEVIRELDSRVPNQVDPLSGWADGVSLLKSHCCILLKPQIILRGEAPADKCIVAAAQARLQSFAIMDLANLEDSISGKIMSRNYTSLSGLQTFAPTKVLSTANGSVPLEVLIDLRCESDAFERLVPQTEAIFHYDKFNRLRLRNKTTSVTSKVTVTHDAASASDGHLQDQTDLIRVHIPRFTVSANAEHFEAISNIVTKLLLFSDPAHKTRLDKLETLVFKYDFTDLASAAIVVASLQSRLRDALETERLTRRNWRRLEEDGRIALLHLQAHIFLLSEELNLLFDSIKMAQDRCDDQADQKSALLLHASSSEISWRMLDERKNLLSKLVVMNINFHWLSRQDSSTVNNLAIGNLSAFDGSRYALWTEILSKYDEPPNHPLLKRGLFLLANWTILAPVGGITIYEVFELSLHPLRLQIDAKVGRRILEYVWPDRARRAIAREPEKSHAVVPPEITVKSPTSAGRSSFDSPHGLQSGKSGDSKPPMPSLRRLGSSRSFTDLKSARESSIANPTTFLSPQGFLSPTGLLKRTHSSDSVNFSNMMDASIAAQSADLDSSTVHNNQNDIGDAQVMKTRSSQKSFVLVRISSLHLLLSVVKEGSFECHDAKIKTRELEYRNQTWSFEELVNQFIPSNMNWRGWVKMAFHQPLVPVLPVARELLAKTKWTASSKPQPHDSPLRLLHPRILATDDDQRINWTISEAARKTEISSKSSWRNALRHNKESPKLTSLPLTDEPEQIDNTELPSGSDRPTTRKRVKSLFSKGSRSKSRGADKRQSDDMLKT
ncbi:hypothetical protein BDN70DRAFT_871269 [Pholiota conissans]|uniref:Uncharacterized protein n=1 Tax=Pholiota conissans TaxID=109636 RepID=A0A9P5ZDQ4_9AGAR|nr:hypothetical protein BDN70DRAFT_871269 [Pholiota conissans]